MVTRMSTEIAPAVRPRATAGGVPRPRRALKVLFDWLPLLPFLLTVGVVLIGAAVLLVVLSLQNPDGSWSLDAWERIFQPGRTHLGAILSSLNVSLWTCTICTLVGTPLAWYIHFMARRGRSLAIAITNTAANFVGVSLAVAFIITLGASGVVTRMLAEGMGIDIGSWLFSESGLVLVFCYFTIPLYVLLVLPAMAAVKDTWWEAVQVASGTRWHYWRHVGIPVLAPFCLGGWALTFAWSMGQFAVVVALKSTVPSWQLITERIGNMITTGSVFANQSQEAAAFSVLLMLFSSVALGLYIWLSRRPMKRLEGM